MKRLRAVAAVGLIGAALGVFAIVPTMTAGSAAQSDGSSSNVTNEARTRATNYFRSSGGSSA